MICCPGRIIPDSNLTGPNNIYIYWPIDIMVRVFTIDLGDWGSISGWVKPKTQKMVLDASLLDTLHYKGMDQV